MSLDDLLLKGQELTNKIHTGLARQFFFLIRFDIVLTRTSQCLPRRAQLINFQREGSLPFPPRLPKGRLSLSLLDRIPSSAPTTLRRRSILPPSRPCRPSSPPYSHISKSTLSPPLPPSSSSKQPPRIKSVRSSRRSNPSRPLPAVDDLENSSEFRLVRSFPFFHSILYLLDFYHSQLSYRTVCSSFQAETRRAPLNYRHTESFSLLDRDCSISLFVISLSLYHYFVGVGICIEVW